MRKDSLIVFATSIVLTLGIVGVAHYLYLQDQKLIPDRPISKPRAVVGAVQSSPQTIQPTKRSNQPTKRRTNKIIQCTQANGSVFWTNAGSCANANLNNTLSYYEHVSPAPRVKKDNKRKTSSRQNYRQAKNSIKPIPRDMHFSCSFPIGKAQRIEKKSLRLKDDPSESLWKESYCRWVCEARFERCEDIKDYLDMTRLCPNRYIRKKSDCND